MRIEQVQAKKAGLVGALMDLGLIVGALLSMGGAPTKHSTFFIEAAQPAAAEVASTAPDSISPGEEIADRDSLDQQLD
jgi:hypothetical protein